MSQRKYNDRPPNIKTDAIQGSYSTSANAYMPNNRENFGQYVYTDSESEDEDPLPAAQSPAYGYQNSQATTWQRQEEDDEGKAAKWRIVQAIIFCLAISLLFPSLSSDTSSGVSGKTKGFACKTGIGEKVLGWERGKDGEAGLMCDGKPNWGFADSKVTLEDAVKDWISVSTEGVEKNNGIDSIAATLEWMQKLVGEGDDLKLRLRKSRIAFVSDMIQISSQDRKLGKRLEPLKENYKAAVDEAQEAVEKQNKKVGQVVDYVVSYINYAVRELENIDKDGNSLSGFIWNNILSEQGKRNQRIAKIRMAFLKFTERVSQQAEKAISIKKSDPFQNLEEAVLAIVSEVAGDKFDQDRLGEKKYWTKKVYHEFADTGLNVNKLASGSAALWDTVKDGLTFSKHTQRGLKVLISSISEFYGLTIGDEIHHRFVEKRLTEYIEMLKRAAEKIDKARDALKMREIPELDREL